VRLGSFCIEAHRPRVFYGLLAEVSSVEENRHDEMGDMDCRQVAGEPCRQVDVGDRPALGAERLGNISLRTSEAIWQRPHLPGNHAARDGCTPVCPLHQSRIQHVRHLRMDHASVRGTP
jgi:hypothetical protein